MIVFAHLLNDRSGSPRVLSAAIAALAQRGDESRLFLGSEGSGFLDDAGIDTTRYWYRRTPYRPITFLTYVASQVSLLVDLLRTRNIDRDALIYVNTLLPFGAAIYGWLTGRRVVYHVHETSLSPVLLRWFLVGVARVTSVLNIYVSDAHARALPIEGVRSAKLYNALSTEFSTKAFATEYRHRRCGMFKVLMVASLRDYKGVPELLKLAADFSEVKDIRFDLVVNDDQSAISRYFKKKQLPSNLSVHPRVADICPFYAQAGLVLNLSRVDECVETFGLTVLEAMSFGVPVIVPPVGGPAELVMDGIQGLWIDSKLSRDLFAAVDLLRTDAIFCQTLSVACRSRAADFSQSAFVSGLQQLVAQCHANSDV